jgi:hypothetical protein
MTEHNESANQDAVALWSTDEVGVFLGYTGTPKSIRAAVTTWMARRGIVPVARQPGTRGLNLYSAAQVQRHKALMPGRGQWGRD